MDPEVIELNLAAPEVFRQTLAEVEAAMETARHPLAPDYFIETKVYRPLFGLHRQLVDHAILNGWTTDAGRT